MKEQAIEKLKKEYPKAIGNVKEVINNVLIDEINNSEEFALKVLNEEKDTTKMWKFISECARKWLSKHKGNYISPAIVLSLGLHYFEEENPEYVEEMMQEEELEFGVKRNEYTLNKLKITKEIEKEVIKEVEKITKKQVKVIDSSLNEIDLRSIKKSIEEKLKMIESKRVAKNDEKVKDEVKEQVLDQLQLF